MLRLARVQACKSIVEWGMQMKSLLSYLIAGKWSVCILFSEDAPKLSTLQDYCLCDDAVSTSLSSNYCQVVSDLFYLFTIIHACILGRWWGIISSQFRRLHTSFYLPGTCWQYMFQTASVLECNRWHSLTKVVPLCA